MKAGDAAAACVLNIMPVSYTHLLVFGTATKEHKAATRASWDHWDIIHTVIILAITGAFYWYFW